MADIKEKRYAPIAQGRSQPSTAKSKTTVSWPRQLSTVRICKIPFYNWVNFTHGQVGHYWVEIDPIGGAADSESYGWYPDDGFPLRSIVLSLSVPGCLNADGPTRKKQRNSAGKSKNKVTVGGGIGTKPYPWDPHQKQKKIEPPDFIIRPYIHDSRSDEQIHAEIRSFAASFSQKYNNRWAFHEEANDEANCHSFVWFMMRDCKLFDPQLLEQDMHFKSLSLSNQVLYADNLTKDGSYTNKVMWMARDLKNMTEAVRLWLGIKQ